jgi:hypothetical protein
MIDTREPVAEASVDVRARRAPLGVVSCYLLGLVGGTLALTFVHQLGDLMRL